MGSPVSLQGNSNNNLLVNAGPGLFTAQVNAFEGNDTVTLEGDYEFSYVGLDGDNDILLVGDTGAGNSLFVTSTVYGGNGEDNLAFFTTAFRDNLISLDEGNDRLLISTSVIKAPATGANVLRNTFLGGSGTDALFFDNTLRSFNRNVVELGENENTPGGPSIDFLVDTILAGTAITDLINDGPLGEYVYLAATEVDLTTIRGGQGTDLIFLESFTGSPEPTVNGGADLAVNRSLINGNQDNDLIVVARNVDNNTAILGGQGTDRFLLISGTFEDSRVNGNLGGDELLFTGIQTNRSSFYGGQGDDTFNVASATIFASQISGDLGDDNINFLAAVSSNTSLYGGQGNDEIDDFSTAIASDGNLLDGGAGNDVLRQAANIFSSISNGATNGVFDYAATFIGGTGSDTMTGDLASQPLTGKRLTPGQDDVEGASSDTFQFSFGDSDITASVARRDQITDFDSNASRYLVNGATAFNNPFLNPFTDFANPNGAVAPAPADFLLLQRERDIIDLTDTDIVINNLGAQITIGGVAQAVSINSLGRVIDSEVTDIDVFVQAGASLVTEGAAIIWEQTAPSIAPRSQLFISNGNGVLDSGDLLIQLDQVAGFVGDQGGLRISNGDITDITFQVA